MAFDPWYYAEHIGDRDYFTATSQANASTDYGLSIIDVFQFMDILGRVASKESRSHGYGWQIAAKTVTFDAGDARIRPAIEEALAFVTRYAQLPVLMDYWSTAEAFAKDWHTSPDGWLPNFLGLNWASGEMAPVVPLMILPWSAGGEACFPGVSTQGTYNGNWCGPVALAYNQTDTTIFDVKFYELTSDFSNIAAHEITHFLYQYVTTWLHRTSDTTLQDIDDHTWVDPPDGSPYAKYTYNVKLMLEQYAHPVYRRLFQWAAKELPAEPVPQKLSRKCGRAHSALMVR